ncbi:cyanamide hydratase family HD domain-containing protein [Colletotrichum salicis]|uniref:Cyanamide hydratase family HD domain-containing protein n=1 Tax=Colletotrichum salicis TaxID=1209931 RepID=A0A135UYW1_9PEZI|nr:cyanamide hydratase family HD domain-containing protein [Colletotrichum salicis]
MCQDEVGLNGWTAVPVDAGKIFGDKPFLNEPTHISVNDIKLPAIDPVVAQTLQYSKERLYPETLNHSMRVFYYGMAITKEQFPEHAAILSPSTWALTSLPHDLGTAEENVSATRMSFDIYGSFKALQALKNLGATADQAEAIAEAIVRHQDTGVDGTITYLGQLIQLATLYDNVGRHPRVNGFERMIHGETRREINEAWPRLGQCS